MAGKMRPLAVSDFANLPAECLGCAFWETAERLPRHCGAACDPDLVSGWAEYVHAQWGDCGRAAHDDGEIIGFIKYAPPGFLPQAQYFPPGPPSDDCVLLACLHVVEDARHLGLGRLLLHAALRDLLARGEKAVEAYAYSGGSVSELPVMSLQFLIKQGFEVKTPHPEFPLMRMKLKSLATVTENVEAMLETLQLPLRVHKRVPTPYIRAER